MRLGRIALLAAVGLPLSVALVAFADRASTEAQGRVIRFAIPSGSGPAIEAGVTSLRRLASERLGNQLTIELVAPGQSVTAEFVWKELKAGRLDMAVVPAAELTFDSPELAIFEIPFLFEDIREVLELQQSDIGQVILASMASHEAFALGFWNEGMTQLFVRQPIHEVRDLQKLRMLSFGSPEGVAMMRALGAAPSRLTRNIPDLQPSDLVDFDAVEAPLTTPLSAVYLASTSDPTSHITETNHKPAFAVFAANHASWDSLPYQTQSAMMDIVSEVQAELNDFIVKESDVARRKFLDENVPFNDFEDAPLDYTAESVAILWSAARAPRVRELVRATLSFLTESRTYQTRGTPRQIRGDRAIENEPFTSVPVYYVTDRLEEHPESIKYRFGTKRGPIQYGSATVDISTRGFASIPSSACEKQWTRSPTNSEVLVSSLETFDSSEQALERIKVDLEKRATDTVLLFVHGYCNSFEDAVIRAGLLSADIKFDGATIAYSWPSREQLTRYRYDKDEARWSASDLSRLLNSLLSNTSFEINVVSHSMGGLVTLEALMYLYPSAVGRKIERVVFAAPDVDRGLFVDEYPNWSPAVNGVTLYSSSKDLAMRFARCYNENRRAGEGGADAIGDDEISLNALDATFVDPTVFAHSYVSTSPWILMDVLQLLRYDEPPAGRANVKRHPTAERWYFPGEHGQVP